MIERLALRFRHATISRSFPDAHPCARGRASSIPGAGVGTIFTGFIIAAILGAFGAPGGVPVHRGRDGDRRAVGGNLGSANKPPLAGGDLRTVRRCRPGSRHGAGREGHGRSARGHCLPRKRLRTTALRELLGSIRDSEEEHVDFLDRRFDLNKQIGVERYILLNSAPAPDQE